MYGPPPATVLGSVRSCGKPTAAKAGAAATPCFAKAAKAAAQASPVKRREVAAKRMKRERSTVRSRSIQVPMSTTLNCLTLPAVAVSVLLPKVLMWTWRGTRPLAQKLRPLQDSSPSTVATTGTAKYGIWDDPNSNSNSKV